MKLFIFNDILNDFSESICVYAKDLNQCRDLFYNQFENDGDRGNFEDFINDEEYHTVIVGIWETPRLITLNAEMCKLLMYTLTTD